MPRFFCLSPRLLFLTVNHTQKTKDEEDGDDQKKITELVEENESLVQEKEALVRANAELKEKLARAERVAAAAVARAGESAGSTTCVPVTKT